MANAAAETETTTAAAPRHCRANACQEQVAGDEADAVRGESGSDTEAELGGAALLDGGAGDETAELGPLSGKKKARHGVAYLYCSRRLRSLRRRDSLLPPPVPSSGGSRAAQESTDSASAERRRCHRRSRRCRYSLSAPTRGAG
jgi:hypothetical protein